MDSKRRWRCPGCGQTYRIPAHKDDPNLCPQCRTAESEFEPIQAPATIDDDAAQPKDRTTFLSKDLPKPVVGAMALSLVGLVFFTCCGGFSSPDSETSSSGDSSYTSDTRSSRPGVDKTMAWVMAKGFVEKHLKSPSTADFGSVFGEYQDPDDCVKYLGDNKYQVTGWVDAENAFGATVRADFALTVEDGGETWYLVGKPLIIQR